MTVTALCPGPTATEFGEVAGFGGHPLLDKFSARSADVVRAGLDGLARDKALVIPGLINKVTAQGHRLLPRGTLRRIAGTLKL